VDDADDLVEVVAIDRHARMAMLAHQLDEAAEIDVLRRGADVDARRHHVIRGLFAQLQDVEQQRGFAGWSLVGVRGLTFLDQLLDRFTQRGLAAAALQEAEEAAQSLFLSLFGGQFAHRRNS
jgi:hypothetical protein